MNERKIGAFQQCEECKNIFVKTHGRQRFCPPTHQKRSKCENAARMRRKRARRVLEKSSIELERLKREAAEARRKRDENTVIYARIPSPLTVELVCRKCEEPARILLTMNEFVKDNDIYMAKSHDFSYCCLICVEKLILNLQKVNK